MVSVVQYRARRGPTRGNVSLQAYLRDISRVPLLTARRERELARRLIRGNDAAARDQMVLANLRLVVRLARNYVHRGLEMQDLIEEGNIGLLRAVDGFNPDMNIRFSTYASWWIKQSIRRALIRCAPAMHVPAQTVELASKLRRAMSEAQERLQREPSLEELATSLNVTVRKVRMLRRAEGVLRAPARPDSAEGVPLDEAIRDTRSPTPLDIVLGEDAIRTVFLLLTRMERREATILTLRFGLAGQEPLTLNAIAERVGLTRERVRQIETEALSKLNDYISGEAACA